MATIVKGTSIFSSIGANGDKISIGYFSIKKKEISQALTNRYSYNVLQ